MGGGPVCLPSLGSHARLASEASELARVESSCPCISSLHCQGGAALVILLRSYHFTMPSSLRSVAIGILVAVSVLALPLLSSAATASKAKQRPSQVPIEKYLDVCSSLSKSKYPPIKKTDGKRRKVLSTLIGATGLQNFVSAGGPRLKAACWLLYDDPAKLSASSKSKLLERYALLILYFATNGSSWERKNNWLTGKHVSKWEGVTVSRPSIFSLKRHVTKLELPFNDLNKGILPRELSLLKELRELDLRGNDIQGVIPNKLSELKHLKTMDLSMNYIIGKIPTELGLMRSLTELNLMANYLEGPIPRRIGELSKLQLLDVSFTYMGGNIPQELSNCKALKEVYLNDCDFTGQIPKGLCKLELDELWADCLGPSPEVSCDCATVCCRGLPDPKQVDVRKQRDGKKSRGAK